MTHLPGRVLAVLVATLVVAGGCRGRLDRRADGRPGSRGSSPLVAVPGVPSPPPAAAEFRCTRVIGFSQTRQWYSLRDVHFEAYVDDATWELFWHKGAEIAHWANPESRMWTASELVSPCAERSGDPDRVLLTITGEFLPDVAVWAGYIQEAVETIRETYMGVRQIVLQPVVGGPGDGLCQRAGATVRASFNHPYIDEAIAEVVGGDVVTGASPQVGTCEGYQDSAGHLEPEARRQVAQMLGKFYADF